MHALIFIRSLTACICLAAGATALLSSTIAAANPAPEIGTLAGPSVEEISARIELLKSQTDIVAADKELALERLQEALVRMQSANASRALANNYANGLEQAPKTIAALSAQLSAPEAKVADVDAVDADPVEAQLRLASLQIQAVSLRGKQRDLEDSLHAMVSRPVEAREELTELNKQQEKKPDALATDATRVVIDANRVMTDAVRQDISAQIEKVEQELLSLPSQKTIATVQLELSKRSLRQIEAAATALGTRIDAQQQRDAARKLEEANEAAKRFAGQSLAVANLAQGTAELRASMSATVESLRQIRTSQDELRAELADVAASRENVEQILEFGRVNEEYGRLLRDVANDLPGQSVLSRRISRAESMIVDARVQHFRSVQELSAANMEPQDAERFLQANAITPGPAIIETVKTLLDSRRGALNDLLTLQAQQIEALVEVDSLETELLQRTTSLRAVLDARLLWLPSATQFDLTWGRQLLQGLAVVATARNQAELAPAALKTMNARPLSALMLGVVIIGLLSVRRRLVAEIAVLAKPIGSREDRFSLTLYTLFVTFLLAVPMPLALWSLGWLLQVPDNPNAFPSAVGSGLMTAGIALFIMSVIRNMSRHQGLFSAHFRWSAEGCQRLDRALWILALTLTPAIALRGAALTNADPALADGIGRLGLLVGSIAMAVFLFLVFRPKGGALTGGLDRSGIIWRTRFIWYWALVGMPLVLAILAMAGYSASVGELERRLYVSGWTILAIIVAFHVAMRGVVVFARAAAYQQAEARYARMMEETQARAAGDDSGDAAPKLQLESEIDVAEVGQQTRALLRAACGTLLVVLLWGIWSGMVPALGIFNEVVLWSKVTTTATGSTTSAVSLGDLLLSMLLLFLTVVAARNIPGFLEITILQRFSIDSGTRYAIVTMTRYGIFIVGLVAMLNGIGADWSELQWLVAALSVGLGFGMQEIVANFISGIIILFERPVRVGDLIAIDDTVGTVTRIKIRAITITDADNFEVMVPNKAFITGTVKNWSLTNPVTRIVLKVGVAYGSDVALAQKILLDVAAADEQVLDMPTPIVLFLGFGDSSLELELRVFVGNIDHRLPTMNNLYVAVHTAFNEAGIEIPFPQRDVHVHPAKGAPEKVQLSVDDAPFNSDPR